MRFWATLQLFVSLGSSHGQPCAVRVPFSHTVPSGLLVVHWFHLEFRWWTVQEVGAVGFVEQLALGIPAVGSPNGDHPVVGESHRLPVRCIVMTSLWKLCPGIVPGWLVTHIL